MSTILSAPEGRLATPPRLPRRLADGLFLALVAGAVGYVLLRHHSALDEYDLAILGCSAVSLCVLALRWRALQVLGATCGLLAVGAVALYRGDPARAEEAFLLRHFLSSQSAILWMGLSFWAATLLYAIGWWKASGAWLRRGACAAWIGSAAGLLGLLVRWHESYLLGDGIGHIPVSNLYEVFVLFCFLTTLLYLHLEHRSGNRQLGLFAMLPVSAAVAFVFVYGRGAHEIQPLIPALQSWWMKLHVPANFIGYGAFSIAAATGAAWLLAGIPALAARLPSRRWLDELCYRSSALGFVFFTIATILGALWAAEAWGGYWSWDPKETWALVVWLNYAAWLHARLVRQISGKALAWWSLAGFCITLFAFVGVNMFLSGLHSYGAL